MTSKQEKQKLIESINKYRENKHKRKAKTIIGKIKEKILLKRLEVLDDQLPRFVENNITKALQFYEGRKTHALSHKTFKFYYKKKYLRFQLREINGH